MLIGYHINKFRLFKAFQILVTIICGVIEAAEFIAYSSYVDDVNLSGFYNVQLSKLDYFENTNIVDGQVKIWYYIVIFLTLIGIKLCGTLGLGGIANFDPWYTGSGNGLNCNIASENTNNPIVIVIVNWEIFLCQLAIASLIVCWLNIGLLLLSLLISWRRAIELSWILTPSSSFNDDIRGNMEEIIDSTNERTNHEPANF
ncbi:hypothetical protein C2G38_2240306 [Gigaspora rosea]|uniref:Uncharacterized protein n=1 Tax=Gigaspora rosea TaxID=44941 RepID=A0A397W0Q8_9GLOM|nr:hypothetical protein C2G38_2240306 [Gigaspora rosea]